MPLVPILKHRFSKRAYQLFLMASALVPGLGGGGTVHAILLMGLQASGKSTFYQQRFADSHVRINLDMLRTRRREHLLLTACIEAGQPLVIDNTNPTAEDRARYLSPLRDAGFQVDGYYFSSKLSECLERNRNREGRARIPELGLRHTSARFQLPRIKEGFSRLYYVQLIGQTFQVEAFVEA